MRRWGPLLALAATLLGAARPAAAHTTATGLASYQVEGADVRYRLTVVLGELPEAARALLAAAADGDPARADQVGRELRHRVRAWSGAQPCRPGRAVVQGSRLADGKVELGLLLRCPSPPERLRLRDDWPGIFGEHYRTLARVDAAAVAELAFSREAPEQEVALAPRGGLSRQGGFFRLGLEHILGGYDHLLFLAALLLCGGGLVSLLKTVTAFTVAHSVSLALSVLGLVVLPARLVEPLIAASIVWVALENVRGRARPSRRWLVSFAFGLVHGFGFASALQELALPQGRLAWALASFNLGVEAGQALVVAAALPVTLWLRRVRWEPAAVRLASLALAATGSVWLVQRLFFA